nr:flavin reductase [Gemmatimonadota bacterium]
MIFHTAELSGRERYQLLTSLVVPRPIAWVSTRSEAGAPNLAPFSYFAALSSSPFLVGISIGTREGEPKDSLRNIRTTGAFCVNVVTEAQLEGSANTLVIGEVLLVRLADAAPRVPGKHFVDSVALHPVGRLWGDWYSLLG